MVDRIKGFSKIYENTDEEIPEDGGQYLWYRKTQRCGIQLSEIKLITVQHNETFYEW